MPEFQPLVNAPALQRVERLYRSRVLTDPCDHIARSRLAWCLFLMSLHRAGQESVLHRLGLPSEPLRESSIEEPEAQSLLDECLRHSETVINLSLAVEERVEMERLLGLARLTIGDAAFAAAEGKAGAILDSLVEDLRDR